MQTQICSTLMEVLRVRATSDPAHVLYSFLRDDLSVSQDISLGFLDLRARSVAAFIQSETSPGDRVLLVYPFGPGFLEGFFGSIYAGRIPVPAYAPRPGRPNHTLKAICNDAQPSIVLTNHEQAPRIKEALGAGSSSPELRCCCVEDIPDHGAEAWIEPEIDSRTIAFLQYTSGSTAAPKGVIVSHGNIVHNERMIQEAFSQDESSVVVSWLPLYHDMGLIGGVLQPLWAGSRCFLMSPQTFVQNPFQWLHAISRLKGTTSGGPDFAYRLCIARITSEQLAALDLSSWLVAFNGSEPVQAATIRQFSQKFGPRGFHRSAFVPCYGLAESTLLVTARRNSAEPAVRSFRSRELERNCVVPCAENDLGARLLVGCGAGSASQDVVVVDPESGSVCDGGQVGEILISGPHVAQGYWNKTKETAEIFNQKIAGREGNYVRTGDLGFALENELFIAGRSRDLIVLRGRNFYPQDFEMLAAQSHEAFQSGLTAAFDVDTAAEPELVIVQETQNRALDFQTACQVIREAIVGEYDVSPGRIIFVRSGSLARTSSGKIRRQQCKADFLASNLKLVFEEAGKKTVPEINIASAAPIDETQNPNPPRHQDYLAGLIKKILRLSGREIDPKVSLLALGLDSIAAAELKTTIAQDLKVDVSLESMLQGISLTELAILVGQERPVVAMEKWPAESPGSSTYLLSQGQLAIWYLSRLSPDSAAYNIAIAVQCGQEVNEEILKQSFTVLMRRHEALRTVIRSGDHGPYQLILEHPVLSFTVERPEALSEELLQDLLTEAAERPFDLETGPLFRISIFRTGKTKRVLLLVFHHIIVDFLSLELVLDELGSVYQALLRGETCVFPTEAGRYRDYIEWQRRMLVGDQGSKLKSFWHEQLQGDLPVTELPSSRVRPAVQTYRGSSWRFRIDSKVTRVINAQAKALGVSLYSMLLSGFEILVHRHTWQPEITVGTPVSGRLSSRWEKTVGLFMNQVVLRPRFSGEMKISDFIRGTHREAAAALEHQEYPFSLLVEQLQPRRDPSHSPLFQVMFSFYRAGQPEHKGLEGFLLGVPEIELQVGDLKLCSMALENRTAQLDLTLSVAEVGGELLGNLQWNADVFEREAMSDVARHYASLLEAIAADPGTPISDLAVVKLGDETLLEGPNDSILQFGPEECVQNLIMAQIEACPSAAALVAGHESLTYEELGMKAASLADYLHSLGIGPDVPVAIFASRSARLLTGMLGTLFAGGAFVPIDPSMPPERTALMIAESHAKVVLTEEKLLPRLPQTTAAAICLDEEFFNTVAFSKVSSNVKHENLAYILFTSGSTGKPKGVMVSHGNLVSFCRAMDQQVSCNPGDRFFSSTSISFDISILELLWPLTRGAQVALLPEQFRFGATAKTNGKAGQEMDFSVFYFSSVDSADDLDKYKLMIEGAQYADRHGFSAVWTPERHFHEFGGLFPNPSVTSAALATITRRIGIRAGSVVLPLHNPIRVAEEWAVVDNLSKGRVGMALASGWHADDFAFFPDCYEGRKELLYRNLKTLQQLWRGEPVSVRSGSGKTIEVRLYPKPVQPDLPIWITAAGTPETFSRAGEIGANLLTHLLGQSIEKLAANIRSYRESRQKHGHDPNGGKVTLMLHTFLGEDVHSVRNQVRAPFKEYLRSSVDLIANLIRSEGLNLDLSQMKPKDFDDLLSFAFDRYFETSALFGTARTCEGMVSSLREIGVNEIASLVDFGVEPAAALASLREVSLLMENYKSTHRRSSLAATPASVLESRSILQCTPSMARILLSDAGSREFLNRLDTLLIGGESLPSDVVEEVGKVAPNCKVHNMYGPTETTIWSATHPVNEIIHPIPIGTPLANTTIHILDNYGQPVPIGMRGEIYIGGIGVARGYVNSPSMTAERFVPDAFSERSGMRLYRTGDMGRYKRDGTIEFLGRNDSQVKIRGFRIELLEIQAAIAVHPDVRQCVVSVREAEGNRSLVAHLVSNGTKALKADELRKFLKQSLPEYMVPSQFIFLNEMPLNSSGKIDPKKLPEIDKLRPLLETKLVSPRDQVEGAVSAIWKRVLRIPELGIDDNFFDLGGHSLLMVQTHREVEEEFHITIPLIKLLEHPTVRALADYIRGSAQNNNSGELEERADKRMKAMLLQRENAARARSTINVS